VKWIKKILSSTTSLFSAWALLKVIDQHRMANSYFKFKQFIVHQEHAPFKITTDSVLLGAWAQLAGAGNILDIGTGTGILTLMAAQRSEARIVAIEPDPGAYMQAGLNISDSPWHERITLINTRVQDYFPEAGLLFDAVITNPPFFVDSLPNPDPGKAMARHSLTLSFRELLEAAIRLMVPSGTLHLVLPVNEAGQIIEMAGSLGLSCQRKLNIRPAPDTPPSRVLMSLGYSQDNVEESTMVIEKGGRHNYSDEYVSLTKDFYLKF
jgi:tRNA1Val (adenine37-N6)-methyltransferase